MFHKRHFRLPARGAAAKYIAAAIAMASFLSGCKPTENNYRNAYDKAYEAAQRKSREASTASDGTALESLDAPRMEIVDGDTVLVHRNPVKIFETSTDTAEEDGKIGIAVARYSMPTNARRHMQDMSAEYPGTFLATDGDDNYYVVIKRVKSVPETVEPIRIFRLAHPTYPYNGLKSEPLVLTLQN